VSKDQTAKTIDDFGVQWTNFRDNDGYYGSIELFKDAFPLVPVEEIEGQHVLDIGSGTGRIVNMLLAAGAGHVTAVEPSDAYDVMLENTEHAREKVTGIRCPGNEIDLDQACDLVFSFGVIHHIPDPKPVLEAAFRALKPGGKITIWVYGWEGNVPYLAVVLPMRMITSHLPHWALQLVSRLMDIPLVIYVWLCRFLPLPLAKYMREVIAKLTPEKRVWNIYDQLNPAYAKYYRRPEAISVLEKAGFIDVDAFHRHGYSWSVVGTKPEV